MLSHNVNVYNAQNVFNYINCVNALKIANTQHIITNGGNTMSNRWIVHSDINHCYAQIEEMKFPQLRKVPMAVGGNEESRHGIILAKNDLAKEYNIKTGESLREALKKCPELVIINPNYDEYMYYTEQVKDIYREYTDKVESFGLDEAWIDLTGSEKLFGNPIEIAKTIQNRVHDELGLTVSMGVSYNKIFAKLGSDMNKHLGFTVITKDNFKSLIWNLPIGDLFYVGKATEEKLNNIKIKTIGDLANSNVKKLTAILGINGSMLWGFANGLDTTEVVKMSHSRDVKSIGNSITTVHDITSYEEIKMVLYVLCESVASRLRENGVGGTVVSISLRDKNLNRFTRQKKVLDYIDTSNTIMEVVESLIHKNCYTDCHGKFEIPFRSIGVSVSNLINSKSRQISLFDDFEQKEKEKQIEITIDLIRNKYGFDKIKRLIMLKDIKLTDFNPKGDHVIFPESWF